MGAERLLSIVLLLQTRGRLTARRLAELLEVSERTIQRDMEALSMAGIPIYAERGISGGWSLVEGFRSQLTALTAAEIATLFLAKPACLLMDLGMDKSANAALDKLLALLPAIDRRNAEFMRRCIHIDLVDLPQVAEEVTFLALLQSALWQERQVQISYTMNNRAMLEARIAPLGLVARGSIWYLVAAYEAQATTEIGVYRIARIQAAYLTNYSAKWPKDFNLAECWEALSTALLTTRNQYQVTASIHCSILARLRCDGRLADGQAHPRLSTSAEWHEVTLHFHCAEEACEYLLVLGMQVEVVEPLALRELLYARALALAAHYTQPPLPVAA